METYELYVEDDRYSVPTLAFVTATTDGRAKAKAAELLLQSPHHLSVEIYRDGSFLFAVEGKRRRLADGDDNGSAQRP